MLYSYRYFVVIILGVNEETVLTVAILDVHHGLSLQQQGEQLRSACESSMMQC